MEVEAKSWEGRRGTRVFRCFSDHWLVSMPMDRCEVSKNAGTGNLEAMVGMTREDAGALADLLMRVLEATIGEDEDGPEKEMSDYEKGFADGLMSKP